MAKKNLPIHLTFNVELVLGSIRKSSIESFVSRSNSRLFLRSSSKSIGNFPKGLYLNYKTFMAYSFLNIV